MDNPRTHDTISQQPITHTPSTCLTAVSTLSASHPVSLASLPPFTLTYLAEGNANVIYTLHPIPQTQPQDTDRTSTPTSPLTLHPNCTVLRLRKDLPFTQPAIEVLSAFRQKIQPLFADGFADVLVEQSLFRMGRETVESVDLMLKGMEGERESLGVGVGVGVGEGEGGDGVGWCVRPVHRRGFYHPVFEMECYGILMPNLLSLGANPSTPSTRASQDGKDANHKDKSKMKTKTRLLEFKAKWLLQSPSAPEDAVRCRTCAVNSLRRLKNREKQEQTQTQTSEKSEQNQKPKQKQIHKQKQKLGRGDGGFCPFALLAHDQSTATLHSALTTMGLFTHCKTSRAQTKLQKEFMHKVQPVLRHLRRLQGRFNCVGLQDFRRGNTSLQGSTNANADVDVDVDVNVSGKPATEPEPKFEGDFAVAMALRDCSIFLVVVEPEDEVEDQDENKTKNQNQNDDEVDDGDVPSIKAVKLADLDLKTTGGGKLERWAGIEEELIRSGMYTMSSGELEELMAEGEGDVCVWRKFEGR